MLLINSLTIHSGIPMLFSNSQNIAQSVKWSSNTIDIEINPSTGSALTNEEVLAELNLAMDQWQNIGSSSINFNRITTFTSPVNFGPTIDQRNIITFVSDPLFPPGVIGITFLTADTDAREIVDADMQFNQGEFVFITKASGPSNPNNNRIVLSAVATHEFGHLLGFDHSPLSNQTVDIFSIPESTMFPIFSDDQSSLEQDDISILSFTYPSSSNVYKNVIEGKIVSGDFFPETITGAHVIAWDRIGNPNVAISTISGVSTTGVSLEGKYRIEGIPLGNYSIYIEPFPVTNSAIRLENNFTFLDQLSPTLRSIYLLKARSFIPEFYNGDSESAYELDSGLNNATVLQVDNTNERRYHRVDLVTNLANPDINLNGSTISLDNKIIYANGNTSTLVRFQPKDRFGNIIPADLSSRIEFSISTGSFSPLSPITTATPSLINDGSFTYFSQIYSPILTGNSSLLIALITVKFDGQQIDNLRQEIRFEKANPDLTQIQFIPDIKKFNLDGFEQASRPVYADGIAPATFRITPKFSDGTIIDEPIETSWPLSGISVVPADNTITTFPLISLPGNQYQTTLTNSAAGLVQPVLFLDGIKFDQFNSVSFNSVSAGSNLRIDSQRIHIKHPDIPQTPKALLTIEPTFSDGSIIPTQIDTSEFEVTITNLDGSLAVNIVKTPILGPFTDANGYPYYQVEIEALNTITTVNILVKISGQSLNQSINLSFDVADPDLCEIKPTKKYILANSSQKQEVHFIARFRDDSIVTSDISKLVLLSCSSGVLSNPSGAFTSTSTPAINPSQKSAGILTVVFTPGNIEELVSVTANIQSNGFKRVAQEGKINVVNANQNLLRIELLDESIPANGKSITTMIVTPLFPDNSIIGKEFNEASLSASISDGEFLKKVPSNFNPSQFTLVPFGNQNVSFFNSGKTDPLKNGQFELSIRSANFSTVATIEFYINNVLSLITEQITFGVLGSADPQRTSIRIDNPYLYADGRSITRIDIFPKSANGQKVDLPNSSNITIQTNAGKLIGALEKNLDSSFSQLIQSELSSVNKVAYLTIVIDGSIVSPNQPIELYFLNLNVNNIVNNISYPDSDLIDGYDISILASAIRKKSCENGVGDCRLDFNLDGFVNIEDMRILEKSYGSTTNN